MCNHIWWDYRAIFFMVMAMWMARVILKCWGDTITYYIPQLKRRKTSLKNNEKHVLPTGWSHCSLHWGCPTVLCTWNITRIISRKCEFSWPPYSPYLNPCDVFMGPPKGAGVQGRDPAPIQLLKNWRTQSGGKSESWTGTRTCSWPCLTIFWFMEHV